MLMIIVYEYYTLLYRSLVLKLATYADVTAGDESPYRPTWQLFAIGHLPPTRVTFFFSFSMLTWALYLVPAVQHRPRGGGRVAVPVFGQE
jgi:hypothetical protein